MKPRAPLRASVATIASLFRWTANPPGFRSAIIAGLMVAPLGAMGLGGCKQLIDWQPATVWDGGAGGAAGGICTPGSSQACPYTGPNGTEGVGNCKAGFQTCAADGQSWGTCGGEVLPVLDGGCATSAADTCTGMPAAGCCAAGTSVPCYDGPNGTEDAGICKGGMKACGSDGMLGACTGEVTPQQETCANNLDDNCDGFDCVEWAELLGDGATKFVESVAVDATENIYVSGTFAGSIPAGATTLVAPGSNNGFFLKLDPSGKPLLGQGFGTGGVTDEQSFDAIALDSQGNIFIGGRTNTTVMFQGKTVSAGLFVMKFDSAGSLAWTQNLTDAVFCTSSDSFVYSLATTTGGDVVVGGYFCGTINIGGTSTMKSTRSAFLAQLRGSDGSSSATGYWGQVFSDTGTGLQQIQKVAIDPMGNIVVAGQFQGQLNVGLGPFTSLGGYDVFLAKFDATGKALTYEILGGPNDQTFSSMALDPAGGPVVTGTFLQSIGVGGITTQAVGTSPNIFIAHLSAGNSVEWTKFLPTGLSATATVDTQGDVVLFGEFSGSIDLGDGPLTVTAPATYEAFLAKLGQSGTVTWKRGFTNVGGLAIGAATATDSIGQSIVGGSMTGILNFGSGNLSSPSNVGAFLAKFGI